MGPNRFVNNMQNIILVPGIEFVEIFTRMDSEKRQELFLFVMDTINAALMEEDIDKLEDCFGLIKAMSQVTDLQDILCHYCNNNNPTSKTNLLLLACKYNKLHALEYLLRIPDQGILQLIKGNVSCSLAYDVDETGHNALYYTMKSGDIKIFDVLYNWLSRLTDNNEMDEQISKAYYDLKLKNVPLPDDVQYFILDKLVKLGFKTSEQRKHKVNSLNDIILRAESLRKIIMHIIESVNLIDEVFLNALKYIAYSVHILKREMKSTYICLPWEEIEVCCTIFVSSYTNYDGSSLVHHSILTKDKLKNYLSAFSHQLLQECDALRNSNIKDLEALPTNIKRNVVVDSIKQKSIFGQLYDDFEQVMDLYSLNKINKCVDLILSVDLEINDNNAYLIILRALQLIGEYMRNTLEFPKLSNDAMQCLIFLLPQETVKIIIDIRNCLSHADLIYERIELEKVLDYTFITKIQHEIRKLGKVVGDILFKEKANIMRNDLKKIVDAKFMYEIAQILGVYKEFQLCDESEGMLSLFGNCVGDQKYIKQFLTLLHTYDFTRNTTHQHFIRHIKFIAQKLLDDLTQNFPRLQQNAEEIFLIESISQKSFRDVLPYRGNDTIERTKKVKKHLDFIDDAIFGKRQITCLRNIIKSNDHGDLGYKSEKEIEALKHIQYEKKINMLKHVLKSARLMDPVENALASIKSDKQLLATLEMLIFDIIIIICSFEKHMLNDWQFLDNRVPLLVGRNLHNHLAHGNIIVDILPFDHEAIVLSNARFLASLPHSYSNITYRVTQSNPDSIEKMFQKDLKIICVQNNMYSALREGNLKNFLHCVQNGADLRGKCAQLWTVFQYAVIGNNPEILDYLFNQDLDITFKDKANGQSLLHIAASNRSLLVVEYLIEVRKFDVDVTDNFYETSLHVAAQNGFTDVVRRLMKYHAQIFMWNAKGLLPLHVAVMNGFLETAKYFWENGNKIDTFTKDEFTPLHISAELGHLEIILYLIENYANINTVNGTRVTPLHTAALNGHTEIVELLVWRGADINAMSVDNTPLHCAVENGFADIVCILLENNADISIKETSNNSTPLNLAASLGYQEIVEILLAYEADLTIATKDGWNPLHNAAKFGNIDMVNILIKHGSYVNSKTGDGRTALHIAAECGQCDVVELLLIRKTKVDIKDRCKNTPLHVAVEYGNKNVVDILIKAGASINFENVNGSTPLHLSILGGYVDITQTLINLGARVNARNKMNKTPLHLAVEEGIDEVVEILLLAGADINGADNEGCKPIHLSASHGHADIAELLISKYHADVKSKDKYGNIPLQLAVEFNRAGVATLLIDKGSDVNSKNNLGCTPIFHAVENNNIRVCRLLVAKGANVEGCCEKVSLLHVAILESYIDVAELLLEHGANIEELWGGYTPLFAAVKGNQAEVVEYLLKQNANINVTADETTPLHIAAMLGFDNIVTILIAHGAKPNVLDLKNRTALEMAVVHDKLAVVKILLSDTNINARYSDNFTLLHVASQFGHLKMIKYLTSEGADVNASNKSGSKAVHVAAGEGFIDIVEYFLEDELISYYDCSAGGSTVLHYAAIGGHINIAKCLIKKDFDVNVVNMFGQMAIHTAALRNEADFVELLIHNNAIYDAFDVRNKKPVDYATHEDIIKSLKSLDNLFEAVRTSNHLDINNCIKNGTSLNAQDRHELTLLHIAIRNNEEKVVKILLDNKADPNIKSALYDTPLYSAVTSGAINIVKILLSHGAKYDVISTEEGEHQDINDLLTFIKKSFQRSQESDGNLINDLKTINDPETFSAVVHARNKHNKTIFVTAIHNNFPKMDELKQIIQGDISTLKEKSQEICDEADITADMTTDVTTDVLDQQTEKFGQREVRTLDIEEELVLALCDKQKFQEASSMCEKMYAKRKEILGTLDKDTLRIRSTMGLILYSQGRKDEALSILEEVYQKQKDILDPAHEDILSTETRMALLLDDLQKYDQALDVNNKILEKQLKMSRNDDPKTLSVINNIARILNIQGEHEKALEGCREVYEKRKTTLGPKHHLTLWSLCNLGHVYFSCNRYDEALITLREVVLQKASLGLDHLDILNAQNLIGHALFRQGKYLQALKSFEECFAERRSILGVEHPDISKTQELITLLKNTVGTSESFQEEIYVKDVCMAAEFGDKHTMELLIQKGVNVNTSDGQGRTALHFAAFEGHKEIVEVLLTNGADCTAVTNEGNTSLHMACVAGRTEIVNMLLGRLKNNTDSSALPSFINSKATVGGATALHTAAKNGFEKIVLLLLEDGAIYNCEEKQNKTPLDLTSDSNIKYLLQLINELFQDATSGKFVIIDKLHNIEKKYLTAAINARDRNGCTLLRVSMLNKHTDIAPLIGKIMLRI